MQLEDYFDFQRPDDIRLKGSRIGIESILYEYIHRAQTPEEIADRFRTLTLEQVYATILYYLHNKEAVTKYLEDWIEFGRRAREEQRRNPTPEMLRLRQLRAEMEAAKRNEDAKVPLLDEHVSPAYRKQLMRHEPGLTVNIVGDFGAPARGAPDPDLLRWCEENDFVLATNNRS